MFNPQLEQHLALAREETGSNSGEDDTPLTDAVVPETAEMNDTAQLSGPVASDPLPLLDRFKHETSKLYFNVALVAIILVLQGPILRAACLILGLVCAYQRTGAESDKRTSDTDGDDEKGEVSQLQQESRLKISSLLGLIGAPIFEGLEDKKQLDNDCVLSRQALLARLKFLEDFAESQVRLIETVDQSLLILKQASSLKLGLGVRAWSSAERVEQAALGRSLRRRRQGNADPGFTAGFTAGFTVSLPRLRTNLSKVLSRQVELLSLVVEGLGLSNEYLVHRRRDQTDGVVTIALLRTSRNRLVDLLVVVLDVCSLSRHQLTQTSHSSLGRSHTLANEAQRHLLASLGVHPESSDTHEPTALQENLSDLRSQVGAFDVAVLAFQQSLSMGACGDQTQNEETMEWWARVTAIFTTLDAKRRAVGSECLSSKHPDAYGVDEAVHDTNEAIGNVTSVEPRQEYCGGGGGAQELILSRKIPQGRKTFVFSGEGAVTPKAKRIEKFALRYDGPVATAGYDPGVGSSLMQELKDHLQAMPPHDEVDVGIETVESFDAVSVSVPPPPPQVISEVRYVPGLSGAVASMLLSELKTSQIANALEEEEWEFSN